MATVELNSEELQLIYDVLKLTISTSYITVTIASHHAEHLPSHFHRGLFSDVVEEIKVAAGKFSKDSLKKHFKLVDKVSFLQDVKVIADVEKQIANLYFKAFPSEISKTICEWILKKVKSVTLREYKDPEAYNVIGQCRILAWLLMSVMKKVLQSGVGTVEFPAEVLKTFFINWFPTSVHFGICGTLLDPQDIHTGGELLGRLQIDILRKMYIWIRGRIYGPSKLPDPYVSGLQQLVKEVEVELEKLKKPDLEKYEVEHLPQSYPESAVHGTLKTTEGDVETSSSIDSKLVLPTVHVPHAAAPDQNISNCALDIIKGTVSL